MLVTEFAAFPSKDFVYAVICKKTLFFRWRKSETFFLPCTQWRLRGTNHDKYDLCTSTFLLSRYLTIFVSIFSAAVILPPSTVFLVAF